MGIYASVSKQKVVLKVPKQVKCGGVSRNIATIDATIYPPERT